jgi:bla regulator protein blaR1
MTTQSIINHLWQSSCFVLLAGLLAFMLRKNSPKVRYWIWLSASLKFLAPFALLVSLGSVVPRAVRHAISVPAPVFPNTLVQIAEPFSPAYYAAVPKDAPAHAQRYRVPAAMGILCGIFWAMGFFAVMLVRYRSWVRIRATLRASTPIDLPIPVPAFIAPGAEEPGVVGFLRPVLVLPAHFLEHLNPRQLDAVLTHELCHVRRRDNLFAAVHMIVEAVFWFYPLVWWIGSRLVEERERACDEEVVRLGCEPTDYVEAILKVCRFYTECAFPCVSGVTGADIKRRLRAILAGSIARELTIRKKAVLVAVGLAAVVAPITIGVLNAPQVRAQSEAQSQRPAVNLAPQAEAVRPLVAQIAAPKGGAPQGAQQAAQPIAAPPQFEVASVRPAAPLTGGRVTPRGGPGTADPERVNYQSLTVKFLLMMAYGLPVNQVLGPQWIEADRFDITAKVPPGATKEQVNVMLQNLLADRFKLVVHRESREMPLYELVVGKKGSKLKPYVENPDGPKFEHGKITLDKNGEPLPPPGGLVMSMAGGQRTIIASRVTIGGSPSLVVTLGAELGRPVIDKTGLQGFYDYRLVFRPVGPTAGPPVQQIPPADDADAPDILVAVQEQLGLRLEAKKGPVEVLVVDSGNRTPTEN